MSPDEGTNPANDGPLHVLITAAGRRSLATKKAEWDRTASIMHRLLREPA